MRTEEQKRKLAADILGTLKALAPDRVPKPDELTLQAWAEVLGSLNVPDQVWQEAIKVWATEVVGDRMVTPRELHSAAKTVITRWESHPVKSQQLRQWRAQRRDERDRQLKAGTFAEMRGYKPRELY